MISHGAAKYLIEVFEKFSSEEIKPIDEIMFNQLIDISGYQVYQLNPAICVQELQLNQENSVLESGLQKERKKNTVSHTKKTLKQRLIRIKENILRALNKKRWTEQMRAKEAEGKEVIFFK